MSKFISDFRCDVKKICALLGFYIAYSDNSLPMFRDNISVPFLRAKKSKNNAGNTSVRGLNCSVCSFSAQKQTHVLQTIRCILMTLNICSLWVADVKIN